MYNQQTKQSGFIVLMGMLALVIGAGLWFGTLSSLRSTTMAIANNDKHVNELHLIKDRMLAYAVLHPEIYEDAAKVPGPGYFPCPDENGDGDADTNCDVNGAGTDKLFVLGMVPYNIGTRNVTFIDTLKDNSEYWFAVDARFVNSSQRYATGTWARYSNLNSDMAHEVEDSGNTLVYPFTVDGQEDIVMVLFYAGKALSGQNRPSANYTDYLEQPTVVDGSTVDFKSVGANSDVFNDYVVTITRAEWQAAVLSRVGVDVDPKNSTPDLCTMSEALETWFNECRYNNPSFAPSYECTYDAAATDNFQGQNWRGVICPE